MSRSGSSTKAGWPARENARPGRRSCAAGNLRLSRQRNRFGLGPVALSCQSGPTQRRSLACGPTLESEEIGNDYGRAVPGVLFKRTSCGRGVAMTRATRERERRFADALIDLYIAWREECSAVQLAYERWREAAQEDREAAFAAYNLALDREER